MESVSDQRQGNLRVCVRVKPLSEKQVERGAENCVRYDSENKQVILKAKPVSHIRPCEGKREYAFPVEHFYDGRHSSEHLHQDLVKDIVHNFMQGYNGTVMAYGQTGSGKTHTMFGGDRLDKSHDPGIIKGICTQVLNELSSLDSKEWSLTVSALEIYNDHIFDLSSSTKSGNITVLQGYQPEKNNERTTKVLGLEEWEMRSVDDLVSFVRECSSRRMVSQTQLNNRSSRSHVLFSLILRRYSQKELSAKDEQSTVGTLSKLYLVDLAGSERNKRSGASGENLREAAHINSGLFALGSVIHALSDSQNKSETKLTKQVSYRNSKLTRLLQDSIGGNSLTVFIACVSGYELDLDESRNTLKYACRAKRIKNTATRNIQAATAWKEMVSQKKNELESKKQTEIELLRSSMREKRLSIKTGRQRAIEYDRIRRSLAGKPAHRLSTAENAEKRFSKRDFTQDLKRCMSARQTAPASFSVDEEELAHARALPLPDWNNELCQATSVLETEHPTCPSLMPVDARGWILQEEANSREDMKKIKINPPYTFEVDNNMRKIESSFCRPLKIDIYIR